jgi:2-methylcitrate dehydratase PrpD
MNIGVKPYPSCRFAHAAVDVILDEVRAKRLDAADVEAIEIGLARKCMDIVATPQTMKRRPQSVVEGQFSVHFNVALALQEGGFGWDDYAKHVGNARTEALCDRITVVNDPEIEALYPEHLSAAVTITTKSGKKRRIVQQDPRGEPSNWLSDADMRRKFTALASPYLGDGHSRLLADRILALSSQTHVRDLLEISRPATAGRTFAA